jgi:hypothetical protein
MQAGPEARLMRRLGSFGAAVAAVAQLSAAQQVPEGVHREATGPSEMCGIAGRDALDIVAQAKTSDDLRPIPIGTERFIMFANADQSYQLVATTPSEAAYPAVTCRHTYERDGSVRMNRSMRCDAGRAECDALFLEFQALDAELTRSLRGN